MVEKEAQHERLYQLAERLGRIVTEKDEQLAAAAARAEEQDRRISELETQLARLRGTVREYPLSFLPFATFGCPLLFACMLSWKHVLILKRIWTTNAVAET